MAKLDLGTLSGAVELDLTPLDKSLQSAIQKVQTWAKGMATAGTSAGVSGGKATGAGFTKGTTDSVASGQAKLTSEGKKAADAVGTGAQSSATAAGAKTGENFTKETSSAVAKGNSTLAGDVYVVLTDWQPDNDPAVTFKAFYNPLINWFWLGAIVLAFGGLVAFQPGKRIENGRQNE